MKRRKICFPMPRFDVGGLERVQLYVASGLVKAGFDVDFFVNEANSKAKELIGSNLKFKKTNVNKIVYLYKLLLHIKKNKPSVIFSSANDIGCLLLVFRKIISPESKIIWTQHLSLKGPFLKSKGLKRIKLLFLMCLMKNFIDKSDAIIAVTESVSKDMRSLLLGYHVSINVIYNPVVDDQFKKMSNEKVKWPWPDKAKPTIVFVGRIDRVKP